MCASVPAPELRVQNDVISPDLLSAACLIQRVYRGYRARRELEGRQLSATNRWVHAVEESQWQQRQRSATLPSNSSVVQAHRNWSQAVRVAKLARGDGHIKKSQHRQSEPLPEMTGKTMDLQYFLEMVDLKHRHGSNLRKYHEYWKTTDCKENFFYWLDHGAGKDLELPACPREQLGREQVRYLSREERVKYLVTIDRMGRFRWVKDNKLIWTNNTHYMDSEDGIVPKQDGDHMESGTSAPIRRARRPSESSQASSLDEDRLDQGPQAETGAKNFVHRRRNIFKRLKDRVFLKDDWWIFVADPSYRLYVGIKKRGSFQHSSFLRGGRIGAAGLIKIRHGKLRDLAPLSGHYRPPSANFHAFVHALREQGADLSRVSITKLYASLVGIEGYFGAKQNVHRAREKIEHKIEKQPR